MERYLEFILNHYILSLSMAVVTYLLIQELFDSAFKRFRYISPLVAVAKMNESNVHLVDVREPHEFSSSHIDEAISITLDKLPNQLTQLAHYQNDPIILVCQNGARAVSAAKILHKNGFRQLFVMSGGMQSWEEDYKLPISSHHRKQNKAKNSD